MENHQGHLSKRVLLVEDDDLLRSVLGGLLQSAGHNTVEVGTAQDALQALVDDRFDVIVSDVMFPGGGAQRIAAALRGLNERPGLVLITGDCAHFRDVDRIDLVNTVCLGKPFGLSELLLSVDTAAAGRNC